MNGVPVVLDHPTANLALEGGGLNLTPPVRVFVLFPLDVVFRLDVSVKGAIVRETLWAQGALVGRARTLQRIQEILQLKAVASTQISTFLLFAHKCHNFSEFFRSSNPNFLRVWPYFPGLDTTNSIFSFSFLKNIIDLPGGQINDRSSGKHFSLPFLPATPSSPSRTLEGTLDLSEFNVNVMTQNNGAHQRSHYGPGIQK